jgi:putative dimethyl sulfoxide reductase chaperone
MTSEEKESFCRTLAYVLSPPDQELADHLRGGAFYSFFHSYLQAWAVDTDILKGFLIDDKSDTILSELRSEYERLFSGLRGEGISLVESLYRPWTLDPQCTLSFASDKGLMMGDPALHLLALYAQCGLEVPEEFRGRPDHLILELGFLAYLYRWATDAKIERFIADHLDWTSVLGEELKGFAPTPFYESAFAVFDLFLKQEKERPEGENDGKKDIH